MLSEARTSQPGLLRHAQDELVQQWVLAGHGVRGVPQALALASVRLRDGAALWQGRREAAAPEVPQRLHQLLEEGRQRVHQLLAGEVRARGQRPHLVQPPLGEGSLLGFE